VADGLSRCQAWGVDPIVFEDRPTLRRPALVCAFGGWNDGGEAATGAINFLRDRWDAKRFAWIDPEEFFDFQVNRPTVGLVDGVTRRLEWPSCDFYHASLAERDVVLLRGLEPNIRWRTFTDAIVDTGKDLGVERLITLGGFLADLPHTRPIRVTGSAPDPAEAARLGMAASRYEGPTGIVGVLHEASNRAGLPSVSLWAAVPHYLPTGPNPKAALALVERLARLLEVSIELSDLERAVQGWSERIDQIVADSAELVEYVQRLEANADLTGEDIVDIPSGEDLARELERFLRDQRGDERGEGGR
jgi:predicted ATP-grasp superfamily ATP-dependent carboligase